MNRNNKNNYILIGMPTSGKSTVGVILAKILGMDFLDTDLLISQREGMLWVKSFKAEVTRSGARSRQHPMPQHIAIGQQSQPTLCQVLS